MNTTINSKRVAATPMTATGMTATEVAAGRTPLRASGGVYDEEDVRLYGTVPAAGHNPNGLTVAQVGAGFRLLAPEEICRAKARLNSTGFRKDIQAWERGWDDSEWAGDSDHKTYRTAKPPGFFLPKVVVDIKSTIAATWIDEKFPVTDAEATCPPPAAPAPDVRRYVHTFVCNACPRTCTMETVSTNPRFAQLPSDMLCPYRLPGFTAIWKAGGPVQTLT